MGDEDLYAGDIAKYVISNPMFRTVLDKIFKV
nr:MAG TPA: hypothetical protein [Crassvirales sp.]